jgi:uncharacterized iron-regulated membrane protein
MLGFSLVLLAIIGIATGLYVWWKRRVDSELAEGAAVEFQRLATADPELVTGLSESRFAELYHKTEFPRLPGYSLAILVTFLLGTPIMFALLSAGDWAMHKFGLIPTPGDVVTRYMLQEDGSVKMINDVPPEALQYYVEDLGGFYYFFGLLGFWVLIVWFFMSRYYKRTPGLLREEIIRERF